MKKSKLISLLCGCGREYAETVILNNGELERAAPPTCIPCAGINRENDRRIILGLRQAKSEQQIQPRDLENMRRAVFSSMARGTNFRLVIA